MEQLAICPSDMQAVKALQTLDFPERVNYAFSTRRFGNISFNHNPGHEEVLNSRRRFLAAAGIELDNLVAMRPVHGVNIEVVGKSDCKSGAYDIESGIGETDALITTERGVALALNPADCAPIIITNEEAEFLAMIHAGRDGTEREIVVKTISHLREMGFDPRNFIAGIGPTNTCYQQKYIMTSDPERWLDFLAIPQRDDLKVQVLGVESSNSPRYKIQASQSEIKLDVDLVGANKKQLIEAGIDSRWVRFSGYCTACNLLARQDSFSYAVSTGNWRDDDFSRAINQKSYPDGRFMAVAQLT